jgi:polysaccharide deacetylase 2 family uncharacterized protein YibQ
MSKKKSIFLLIGFPVFLTSLALMYLYFLAPERFFTPPRQERATKELRPKIAIIIDDLGYDLDIALSLMALDLPISFSVLPHTPFTKHIAEKARERGREVMLHLPMEPRDYPSVNPGSGALLLSMDEPKLRWVMDQDLAQVKGACGANNHMGSSFTECREKMQVVLEELKKKNLFFVDSRTTKNTVGFQMAKQMGLPAARRNIFLDNDHDSGAIKAQMERLLSIARGAGSAIGIGHARMETLETLREYDSVLKSEFRVVPVSELVR